MQLTQKLWSAAALALLVSLSACDKDDDDNGAGQFSKNDAKTQITSFNNNATAELQGLADAEGLKALQDFFDLTIEDDPFGRTGSDKHKVRAFLRKKGREFRSVFVPATVINGKTSGYEPFNFDGNTGVYAWDADVFAFIKMADAEIIEIQFPTRGSSTNNARIELTAYEEEAFEDEFGDTYYEPTLINASLFVNNVKKASIDLDVEFAGDGFPQVAEVKVTITPYSATLILDATGATSSFLNFNMSQGSETLIATEVTVKYEDSSKNEESVSSLEGFVQFRDLKLQGSVDADGANAEDPDFNEFVHLSLYTAQGKKLGDVVFVTENEQAIPYLQYSDGTKEKLETLFQPFVDELEELSESVQTNG